MKFCQVLVYPEPLLHDLHAARPHLLDAPFKEHGPELAQEAPDATALWAPTLAEMGHESQLIVANDVVSQCRWVTEKLEAFKPKNKAHWMRDLVLEQLRKMKPDVLLLGDPEIFDTRFIGKIKNRPSWIITRNDGSSSNSANWRGFDLVLSPHEAGVRRAWKNRAQDARLVPAGFPRATAEAVFQEPVSLDVVYTGKWVPGAEKRNKRITALAKAALRKEQPFRLGLFLDAPSDAELPPAVRKLNQGPRYGLARYRAISSAKISIAEEPEESLGATLPKSVLESTGIGVFTIAPHNDKLSAAFKPDAEVVTYQGTSDLIAKIDEYLAADARRIAIAKAGQERCLTERSMKAQMSRLLERVAHKRGGLAASGRRLWHRLVS